MPPPGRALLRERLALLAPEKVDAFLKAAVDPEPWLALNRLPACVLNREVGLLNVLLDRTSNDRVVGHLPARPVKALALRPAAAFVPPHVAASVRTFALAATRTSKLPPELILIVARFAYARRQTKRLAG